MVNTGMGNSENKPSEQEIQSKRNQRDYNYDQMKKAESKISALEAKKRRLEEAKAVLVRENSSFQGMMGKIVSSEMPLIRDWKGLQYDKLYKKDAIDFTDYYIQHKNQPINKALDELNWAINDIQKEINNQEGLWGKAKNLWNSAKTWLENLFN